MRHLRMVLFVMLSMLVVTTSDVVAQSQVTDHWWAFEKFGVQAAAWRTDSQQLAYWSDNNLNILDLDSGEIRLVFKDTEESPPSTIHLVWSPDQQTIAVSKSMNYYTGFGIFVDVNTGTELWRKVYDNAPDITFAPDSKTVAITDRSGTGLTEYSHLTIADTRTGNKLHTLEYAMLGSSISDTTWSNDSKKLAIAIGGNVEVWDLSRPEPDLSFKADMHWLRSMIWNKAGDQLITSGQALHIWDAASGLPIASYGINNTYTNLLWDDEDNAVFTTGIDLEVIDPTNGKLISRRVPTTIIDNAWMAWSPDGHLVAQYNGKGMWIDQLIAALTPQPRTYQINIEDIPNKPCAISGEVQYAPNGDILLLSSTTVANLSHPRQSARTLKITDDNIDVSLFTADAHQVAFAVSDNNTRTYLLQLWDVQSGKKLHDFAGHTAAITTLAFSHDERFLASGSEDQTIRIWDTQTGQQQALLLGHTGAINSLEFSADGQKLLSAGDTTAHLWDIATDNSLKVLDPYDEYVGNHHVVDAIFSPDETKIILRDHPEDENYGLMVVRIWDTDTQGFIYYKTLDRQFDAIYSPDMKSYIVTKINGSSTLYDTTTNEHVEIQTPNFDYVGGQSTLDFGAYTHKIHGTWVAFSPDGQRLATTLNMDIVPLPSEATPVIQQKPILVVDMKTHQAIALLGDNESIPYRLLFSPDNSQLLAQSLDGTIKLWDVQSHRLLKTWHVISPDKYKPVEDSLS